MDNVLINNIIKQTLNDKEENIFSIPENIIFILEINDLNHKYFLGNLIQDYFLTNIPTVNVIIYNNNNLEIPNFIYDSNNIKIY